MECVSGCFHRQSPPLLRQGQLCARSSPEPHRTGVWALALCLVSPLGEIRQVIKYLLPGQAVHIEQDTTQSPQSIVSSIKWEHKVFLKVHMVESGLPGPVTAGTG